MKLVTYVENYSDPKLGFLTDHGIVAGTSLSEDSTLHSMQCFIDAGRTCWRDIDQLLGNSDLSKIALTTHPRILAPLPEPPQIRDFMVFEQHVIRSMESIIRLQALQTGGDPDAAVAVARAKDTLKPAQAWYDAPLYYKANRFAVSGHGDAIEWPDYSNIMDYECELACVIGVGGSDISAEDAANHIFGFTIFNDFSARDAQFAELPGYLGPSKGKDFDGANAFGPCIVTPDELSSHGGSYGLSMEVAVNGVQRSKGNSSGMYHTFEAMIERASASETLHPGEILGSGTVAGGCGLERMEFLNPNDEITLSIAGIGSLSNTVIRSH